MKKAISTMRRKPSTAPDGLTAEEASGSAKSSHKGSFLSDVLHSASAGNLGRDAGAVLQGIRMMGSGEPMDDRTLLLEHGVSLLQGLPNDSKLGHDAAGDLIGLLYHDLPRPQVSLAGPRSTYRRADGSHNNPWAPEMGKAGSPYARSVPAVRPKPATLPDEGLVFDMLLKRDEFRPHPSGLSSLFFSFATVVIHECFSTNAKDWWINDTSSYVDLSSLYGNNDEQQKGVRRLDGTGRIWPDTVASPAIMLMPPSVVAILILFSRNHNFIANRIRQINEKGWYSCTSHDEDDPAGEEEWERFRQEGGERVAKQDEDIFQLARNVNVAFFAKVVLGDYVSAILNTYRADSDWMLDLGAEIRKKDQTRLERGNGNVVSVEFNVLYHWHAALGKKDAAWIENVFKAGFPHKDLADITPEEFYKVAGGHARELGAKHPREWVLHGLERGPNGRYPDEALAKILKDAVDEPAAAFGARGTPAGLKVVEILGMKRARQWNVATMNEFRQFLNLKPFDSFAEWNPDEKIWKAAEQLYGHVDDLELYPGLAAEMSKPPMPGSGVCPGHTIGRGILDDAVSLVRGDRFLTYDLDTSTLTSWGMKAISKPCPGALNGFLGTIIYNALPFQFPYNSTYALIPFYTPHAVREILTDLKKIKDYDTNRPEREAHLSSLRSFRACKDAFQDRDTFRVFYNDAIRKVTSGRGFLIGHDTHERHDPDKEMIMKALYAPNFTESTTKFFESHADYQIKKMSLPFSNSTRRHIDIVRDVCNVVCVEWVADLLGLPLKTLETPAGLFTVPELRMMLLGLFVFSSFNVIPKAGFFLQESSIKSSDALSKIVVARLKSSSGITDAVQDWFTKGSAYDDSEESEEFFRALMKSGQPPEKLAGDCLATFIPVAGNLTQQTSLLVDLFMRPEYAADAARLHELCRTNTPQADKEILGYIREGMRMQPVVIGLPRVVTRDVNIDDGENGEVRLKRGDRLIIGISKAHMDPSAFPNPEKMDPHRPESDYILLGEGMHFCLGARVAMVGMLATVKSIFRLKNLRRADGRGGHFVRVSHDLAGLEAHSFLDQSSGEQPMPTSLQLWYDADSVDEPTGHEAVKDIKFYKKASHAPQQKDPSVQRRRSSLNPFHRTKSHKSAGPSSPIATNGFTNGINGHHEPNGVNGVNGHHSSNGVLSDEPQRL